MHIFKCDIMKKYIEYFYEFQLTKLINIGDNYFFVVHGYNYCLYQIKENINLSNIERILNITSFIPEFHNVILTKENQMFCVIENKRYILLKINIKSNRLVTMNDILKFKSYSIKFVKKDIYLDWIQLWSKKIDYLEYYINNKGNVNSEIKGILHYFIGLGENAIKYVKDSIKTASINQEMVLSHSRVGVDNTIYSLYNPLNLIIDHSSRDIAEYLKSSFYNDRVNYLEIENLINSNILSDMEYRLLYGRLLFPTFFFDMFDNYEENKLDNTSIILIYNKTTEYEKFLDNIYQMIKKRNTIISIPWLNK